MFSNNYISWQELHLNVSYETTSLSDMQPILQKQPFAAVWKPAKKITFMQGYKKYLQLQEEQEVVQQIVG